MVAIMIAQTPAAVIPKKGWEIYSTVLTKNEQNTIRPILQEKSEDNARWKENKMKQFCSLHKL